VAINPTLEPDSLEFVIANLCCQTSNAHYSTIDDARQFGREICLSFLLQAFFCLYWGEPPWIPAGFLRPSGAQHLAEMGVYHQLGTGPTFVANIAGEGSFLHPSVNPRLLERFEGCSLRMSQTRLDPTFRKRPPSIAGLYQQELDSTASNAVTNGRHLF
jgi:hypothetical protein